MSQRVVVRISREPGAEDLPLPTYETEHAAGMDLRAAVTEPMTIEAGKRALVPTGLRIALPGGYEAQIRPRSGLAIKHGIILPNSPGTIDADYRGEVQVLLVNLGRETFVVRRGERIAQLVFAPVARATLDGGDALSETARGDRGFGHTGR